jgi:hypothetical protein
LRNEDLNIRQERIKPVLTDSLRHTTNQGTTLSDLLGKGYKYFEPRANRPKNDISKHITLSDHYNEIGKLYKPYESFTNST